MLNILLVEDDEFFSEAVRTTLEEKGWKVTSAPDGRAAREIIKVSKPFDLIVSDIQMPFLTGIELLQWVKANKSTPFLLMTGFALIMETQKAHELGADHFLSKPFERHEIVEAVKDICADKLPKFEPVKAVTTEYCKVSIEEFVSSNRFNFDVYVQLGLRFIKIGRKGEPVPTERIHNYREKGLKYLFIKKENFSELVAFNLSLAKTIASSSTITNEKKTNFMRYTGEVLLEKAFVVGLDEELFAEAKTFVTTSINILTDDENTLEILASLNAHSDHLYAHSLCVAIYSTMMAKEMGWTSSPNLFKLCMAGIFHDIGKKEIDPAILTKPRSQLTFAERKEIESHTQRGYEILSSLPKIPSEVVAVAYEHHENILATGYPRALDRHAIHPMSHIVHVATLFAEFLLRSPNHPGMSPAGAIQHLLNHYKESCSSDCVGALCRVFKFQMAS